MIKPVVSSIPILGKDRRKAGIAIGVVGLSINFLIFAMELFSGIKTGSVTIKADSLHNGIDAASSVITIFTFLMTGKRANKKHPFGLGRIEYLSSLLIAFMILGIGFYFLTSSLEKVLHPSSVQFSFIAVSLVLISIPLKVVHFSLSRKFGKKINSSTLKASSSDALSDILILAVAASSLIIEETTGLKTDGYLGIAVSLFILFNGYVAAKSAVASIIGKAPDQTIIDTISSTVLKAEYVVGIHDLIIHDYGPEKIVASVHAEISANVSLTEAHESIHQAEKAIRENGIELVIHIDPITA